MKLILLLAVIAYVAATGGCSDVANVRRGGHFGDFTISLIGPDGEPIHQWKTDRRVDEPESGSWCFIEAKTEKLICITGTVVVEQTKTAGEKLWQN